MDQPTPESPPPDPPPAPQAESPAPSAAPGAPTTRDDRIQARLEHLVGPDETIVAWARAWISREVRMQPLLGARTFDFVVVTDRSLLLYSTGFFTRRARRLVYTSRLDRMFVTLDEVARGHRMRVTARQANPILVELHASDRAQTFVDELVARARGEAP